MKRMPLKLRRICRVLRPWCFLAGIAFALAPLAATSAEPGDDGELIWKFAPSQEFAWTIDETKSVTAPQEGKETEAVIHHIMDFDVKVAAVQGEIATLAVAISRIRAAANVPDGKFSYDSALTKNSKQDSGKNSEAKRKSKSTRAPGDSADEKTLDVESEEFGQEMFASSFAPLVGLKFSVDVDRHCEVKEIEIDSKKLQAIQSDRTLQPSMIFFLKTEFSSAFLGGFVRLPAEKLAEGQTWSSKVVSSASFVGRKPSFEHVLRSAGTETVDGSECRKFVSTVTMAFAPAKNPKYDLGDLLIKIGKQEGSGVLYFDARRGRTASSHWSLTAELLFDEGKAKGQMKLDVKSVLRDGRHPPPSDPGSLVVPRVRQSAVETAHDESPQPSTQDPPVTKTPSGKSAGQRAGEERDDNGVGMKLVWCPPGRFTMGSPESEKGGRVDQDQVDVTLTKGFWLGKYEVTQGEYARITGRNPSCFSAKGIGSAKVSGQNTDRFPVECVSWDEAMKFCRKLTDQERQAARLPSGWEYTLPTEAQWEYACRAGTTSVFSFGDTLNGREANCNADYPYGVTTKGPNLGRTTTVGSYNANKWGLHDMHGNVWEWCRDSYFYKLPGGADPKGPSDGDFRVYRGGSWSHSAGLCRSATRYWYSSVDADNTAASVWP